MRGTACDSIASTTLGIHRENALPRLQKRPIPLGQEALAACLQDTHKRQNDHELKPQPECQMG
jgi:hypothetical protein